MAKDPEERPRFRADARTRAEQRLALTTEAEFEATLLRRIETYWGSALPCVHRVDGASDPSQRRSSWPSK